MTPDRKTTRRQFLSGESALDAVGDIGSASNTEERDNRSARGGGQAGYLLQIARQAMACEFAVYLNAGQHEDGAERAVEALDLVEGLEAQMTVYRDDSELSRINQTASKQAVPVESQLFQLLARAQSLFEQTSGAFDITAGPLTKLWGFHRRQGHVPNDAEIERVLQHVGGNLLNLNEDHETVGFKSPDLELNLGGIGKGYALDRCCELLVDHDIENFLIHGGQSSVAARGRRSEAGDQARGWSVGLTHPLRPDRRLCEFYLRDQALGTSGSGTQSFRHEGRRYGHILDPRNGRPAEGVLTATVIAPDAATADALATGCYVLGVERALEVCRMLSSVAVILVTEGSRSGSVRIHSQGLSDDDWQCFEN